MRPSRMKEISAVVAVALIVALVAVGNCLVLKGCATIQVEHPEMALVRAQKAYVSAWETYHQMWQALPDEDPRKDEWVDKYHHAFLHAGKLLQAWAKTPGSFSAQIAFEAVFDPLGEWLMEQMLKTDFDERRQIWIPIMLQC